MSTSNTFIQTSAGDILSLRNQSRPIWMVVPLCRCLSGLALADSTNRTAPRILSARASFLRKVTHHTTRRSLVNAPRRLAKNAGHPRPIAPPPPVRSSALPLNSSTKSSVLGSRLEQFFASGDKVLIYKATNHTAFYLYSYLVGAGLIFGAYNYAAVVLQPLPGEDAPRPLPKWVKYLTIGTAIFVAVFGTRVLVAPIGLLKTITAVAKRPSGSSVIEPHLICEIKAPLPFIPTKTFEVPASQAFLDLELAAAKLQFANIPLNEAQAFTAHYMEHRGTALPQSREGFLGNTWLRIKHDTRRIVLREGFARLRFATRGRFKADLHDCELLDHGRPLAMFTTPDLQPGVGTMSSLRRWVRD